MGTSLPVEPLAIPSPEVPPYRDRSTGLVVFGILQIVLGLLAALFIPFVLLTVFIARKTPMGAMPAGYYVLNISTYGLAAAVLVTLGIGSIRAQRWARDLTLISSWLWLIYGVVTLIMMTAVLPSSMVAGFKAAAASNPQATSLPAGVAAVVATVMIAFLALFMVVLPIIFVAFYRRDDVRETCHRRDLIPRWTETLPLPLLATCLIFGLWALYYILMSFTIPLFPFFGRYLTGLAAAGVCLLLAALDATLAILFYKRLLVGWWLAVGTVLLKGVSTGVTFGRGNLTEAYSRMGWSSQQLHLMEANPMYRSGAFLWLGVAFLLIFIGYLLWIRRYFRSDTPSPPEISRAPLAQ